MLGERHDGRIQAKSLELGSISGEWWRVQCRDVLELRDSE
jgi:hypothetical protein